jgi:hypothetical protein
MHIARVHGNMGPGGGGSRKVACDLCSSKVNANYLPEHRRRRHGGVDLEEPRKEDAEFTIRVDTDGQIWIKIGSQELIKLLEANKE